MIEGASLAASAADALRSQPLFLAMVSALPLTTRPGREPIALRPALLTPDSSLVFQLKIPDLAQPHLAEAIDRQPNPGPKPTHVRLTLRPLLCEQDLGRGALLQSPFTGP